MINLRLPYDPEKKVKMTQIEASHLETPLGCFRIDAFGEQLTSIALADMHGFYEESAAPLLRKAARQFQAYFEGNLSSFSLPLAWGNLDGFRREVLQVVVGIPFGKLMTYGEIAALVGRPRAGQAVGAAVGSNPWLIVVPCHRVVGSDRKLHGFSAPGGLETKTWLLRHEGHEIIKGKVSLKGSL